MPTTEPRQDIADYLRATLIGPKGGDAEVIQGTPLLRYMSGILFPQGTATSLVSDEVSATAEESTADAGDEDDKASSDLPMELATEALPSAVGISFKVKDSARVECACWAARYVKQVQDVESRSNQRGMQAWRRTELAGKATPERVTLSRQRSQQKVFGGFALLTSHWRPQGNGTAIVTVALVNLQTADATGPAPEKALFQVGLRCAVARGDAILPYPQVGRIHKPGSEEEEVEFLYRDSKPYARGHGAAATWALNASGECTDVSVDFIPEALVPYATFELEVGNLDRRCFDLHFLDSGPRKDIVSAFRKLRLAYDTWISEHRNEAAGGEWQQVAARFVDRANHWSHRMELGIDLLATDENAWKAFRYANRAMGCQMVFYGDRRKEPYPRSENRSQPPVSLEGRSWRPFQVAFLLGTIESLCNANSAHRGEVDVIWFPTGGGKTEAYLFLSAFELIRRRLVFGERDGAVAILSRYTYRFLTAQQFQRTAALIAALELLRRDDASLGERQFSLGLWVGGSVTPNDFRKGHEKFELMVASARPANPFILEACPCCNTEIVPSAPRAAQRAWHTSDFGVHSTDSAFRFYCPSSSCPFHSGIPANVVDTALYELPPSMLLGTIDKFAQLPWDDRGRSFFGGVDDCSVPPSLIIQDELHLISGPLGSLAAPYEAAIDTIIRTRGGYAKRIASTATIRNAAEQVRGLYGRRGVVFPSPCGTWDDAFFFRTDRRRPGRMYLGVMGQGYIKPVVGMAWTAAAVLQSINEVQLPEEVLDAYWTLLAYHNSRRELGRTMTATRDEVQTRIDVIASSPAKARRLAEPLELSANMTRSLTEAIRELERKSTRQSPSVDFVPCTNLISVGVDIDRLGIMMVNGQPKLTSEYIQATSRVGRAKVPGLVVTLYSAAKPRDRSHYEDFRAYHEAIYRHVEPTSVTPYALPARERTLHAAIVAMVRHALPWRGFNQAGQVGFTEAIMVESLKLLLDLMIVSDPSEEAGVRELFARRLDEWRQLALSGTDLFYENRQAGMQFQALLAEFGKPQGLSRWRTMNSMRNVDSEVEVKVE